MTVGEACDLNLMLRYLLGICPRHGRPEPVNPAAARLAALRMTERAGEALHAGLLPEDVAAAWPSATPTRRPKRKGVGR